VAKSRNKQRDSPGGLQVRLEFLQAASQARCQVWNFQFFGACHLSVAPARWVGLKNVMPYGGN
jgi:hypothetical protein